MKNTFKNIQIGAAFFCNGNYCIKRSSRTADMYKVPNGELLGRFYYRQTDICTSRP